MKAQDGEIVSLRTESEDLRESHQKEVKDMVNKFDDIAMRFKAKLDEKKQEIKDFKAKVKVMLGKV